jgi:hypothetical protein
MEHVYHVVQLIDYVKVFYDKIACSAESTENLGNEQQSLKTSKNIGRMPMPSCEVAILAAYLMQGQVNAKGI